MTIIQSRPRCRLAASFPALLLLILAALLLVPGGARAASYEDLVGGLGADDFEARDQAVSGLGDLGDGRAVTVLKALEDGRLYLLPDKQIAIDPTGAGDTDHLVSALTGGPITAASAEAPSDNSSSDTSSSDASAGAAPSGPERIRVNNRLRGTIDAALGKLGLFSASREDRLAAAHEALREPTAETSALLAKALQTEKDSAVRAALTISVASARLDSGTTAERIAAIGDLAGSTDPDVRMRLGSVRDEAGLDPQVRAAADRALAGIEQRLKFIEVGVNLFQGVSLGSVLLLAAIGLAVTFGVMGVINMAHGEMIMLGAYATYVVQEAFKSFLPPAWLDYYLLVSLPVAFVVAGLVGILMERTVIRFLYGRPLETLLSTWGISLILQQAVRSVFGAPNKEVANPSWMTGGFEVIGGFTVTWNRLAIILFCFLVLGALTVLIRFSRFGLQMRAVTQNRRMAAVMGIPTHRVDALTFGLGSGIAGMAGVALSQIGNVSPNLGTIYIVDSFMVVVFGGVGNLAGTLVGAMGLGIVNKFLEPFAGAVLGKVVVLVGIILFIQYRPRGLFADKGRAVEG